MCESLISLSSVLNLRFVLQNIVEMTADWQVRIIVSPVLGFKLSFVGFKLSFVTFESGM